MLLPPLPITFVEPKASVADKLDFGEPDIAFVTGLTMTLGLQASTFKEKGKMEMIVSHLITMIYLPHY